MIFDNNSTALGSMDIPVAEGYDFQTGTAKMLIESARNDYAMFKAMLAVDSKEAQIRNESAGYVMEGELMSLSEAAAGGIWQKILALFKKLLAKIKSIFGNFIARLTGLFAKDKTLVRKYKKQIYAKGSALDKMEIKFSKVNHDPTSTVVPTVAKRIEDIATFYEEDDDAMQEKYLKDFFPGSDSPSDKAEYAQALHEYYFEDETTDKLKEFNLSGAQLVSWLDGYDKKLSDIKKNQKKLEDDVARKIKEAEKMVNLTIKNTDGSKDSNTTSVALTPDDQNKAVDTANHTYQSALVYQELTAFTNKCLLDEIAFDYKQHKAAFMKAVTVNPDKLKESSIYADAVAEAAADNVDDVISGYISKEELSEFNAASKNVLDGDVSDDPYANEYDKVSYYTNSPAYKTDGSINTNINSRTESYDFGSLLY